MKSVTTTTGTSSSNENIVASKMASKNVTAKQVKLVAGNTPGDATITATIKDKNGEDITKSFDVEVKYPDLESITLDKSNATIDRGDTLQLNATLNPGNVNNSTLTWESDNTSVATVSNTGLVTAISKGIAHITVSGTTGTTATATITVQNPLATDLLVSSNVTMVEENSTTITAIPKIGEDTVTTDDIRDSINWSSNDSSVIDVSSCNTAHSSSCEVTGLKSGSVTITITTTNVTKTVVITVDALKWQNFATYLESIQSNNTDTMFYDGTSDNNLRYYGKTPNNYVTFNEEKAGWRIIGVFGEKVKLIKSESIGFMAWDTSNSNNWNRPATLRTLLNEGDYYNRSGSYSSNGLTSYAKNMIQESTWYLGAAAWGSDDNPDSNSGRNKTASEWYNLERGTLKAGGLNSSTITNETLNVGLIYPSDYGFSSKNCYSNVYLKSTSDNNNFSQWICSSSTWMLTNESEWMISSRSDNSSLGWVRDKYVYIQTGYVTESHSVRPTLYLKSNVLVATNTGNGSSSNPYKIKLSS